MLWNSRRLRQRRRLREQPDVTTHLHNSADVTRATLNRFVHSSVEVQLLVLAELRMRAEDQEVIILPAL